MAFRIFIAVVLIAAAYFGFETVRLAWLQHSVLSADDAYVLGAKDGDVTLVKFLDYECKHCKDADPVVMGAVKRDGRVRFIPRPIGHEHEDGYYLSRLPYAAAQQGKFFEMHAVLIENYRVVDEAVLRDLAQEAGVDFDRLVVDYESKTVIKLAERNEALFKKLRLRGTPSYSVGKTILFSPFDTPPDVDDFIAIFNEARALK